MGVPSPSGTPERGLVLKALFCSSGDRVWRGLSGGGGMTHRAVSRLGYEDEMNQWWVKRYGGD